MTDAGLLPFFDGKVTPAESKKQVIPLAKAVEIEAGLMTAELELDGIKTHITMRKENCPLYETQYDLKVRKALSAVRSARDLFRNAVGTKQWTLTTRGGSNRHGLWHCQVIRNWNCPFCHEETLTIEPGNNEDLARVLEHSEIDPMVAEAILDGASYEELADL